MILNFALVVQHEGYMIKYCTIYLYRITHFNYYSNINCARNKSSYLRVFFYIYIFIEFTFRFEHHSRKLLDIFATKQISFIRTRSSRLKFYLMINSPFSLRKRKPIFSIERKFFKETTSTRILYAMHRYLDIFPRLGKKKKKRPVQFIERLPIYLLEIPSYDKSCGLVSRAQMSCSPFSSKIYARLNRNFEIFLIITRSILFCL